MHQEFIPDHYRITFDENEEFYLFEIIDNGIGIPKDKINEIFDLFSIVASKDKNGNRGNGIGLSTVKKLVANLGGSISVTSEEGKGSTFKFTARKSDIPTLISGPEVDTSDLQK